MFTVFSSAMLAATTVLSLTRPDRTTGEWTCESLVIVADSEVQFTLPMQRAGPNQGTFSQV